MRRQHREGSIISQMQEVDAHKTPSAGDGRNQTNATNRALLRPVVAVRDADRVVLRHFRNQASNF